MRNQKQHFDRLGLSNSSNVDKSAYLTPTARSSPTSLACASQALRQGLVMQRSSSWGRLVSAAKLREQSGPVYAGSTRFYQGRAFGLLDVAHPVRRLAIRIVDASPFDRRGRGGREGDGAGDSRPADSLRPFSASCSRSSWATASSWR